MGCRFTPVAQDYAGYMDVLAAVAVLWPHVLLLSQAGLSRGVGLIMV